MGYWAHLFFLFRNAMETKSSSGIIGCSCADRSGAGGLPVRGATHSVSSTNSTWAKRGSASRVGADGGGLPTCAGGARGAGRDHSIAAVPKIVRHRSSRQKSPCRRARSTLQDRDVHVKIKTLSVACILRLREHTEECHACFECTMHATYPPF
jgi:hypothetical protein